MYSKKFASVVLIAALLWPALVLAQEPLITDLYEGDTAPYDGSLLNPEAMARILAEQEGNSAECDLQIDYAVEQERVSCQFWRDIQEVELEALREQHAAVVDIKDRQIDELTEIIADSGGPSGVWWFVGGVVVGVGVSVGIAAALNNF